MNLMIPKLAVVNGKPTCSSLDVACNFDKDHRNVLRDIRGLMAQLPDDRLLNFEQTIESRPNPKGDGELESPSYRLTQTGFTLLTMGFTGPKALQFKLAYIDAFESMQAGLLHRPESAANQRLQRFEQLRGLPRLDRYQTRAVNQKAAAMGQQLGDVCRDFLIWELAGYVGPRSNHVDDYDLQALLYYASVDDVMAYAQARAKARHKAAFKAIRD